MTRTRPSHTGRERGTGATAPSASRSTQHDKRRRLAAAGLAAATAAGGVITFATMAQAGTPPAGPGNIEIFAKRDMVALEGYAAEAGQKATVTVTRGGEQIGIGQGTIDETGFLEFNHPGGECWIGVTPNISAGDTVDVSFSEATYTDGAVVGSAVITGVTSSPVTATPDVAGDVEGTVTVKGTYGADIDPSRFVVEVVNPAMREAPSAIGERAIGWVPVDDPAHPNGGPGFTATGTFGDGTFEAVFGLQSAADQKLVAEGDHVALSWMADGAADLALGATQYEFEEIDGPGFGGCPAGPGAQAPDVNGLTATWTAAGDGSLSVNVTPPAQPADSSAISGYRFAAVDTGLGQEAAVRSGAPTGTIQELKAGTPYDITVELYNGQWSAPVTVATAVDPGVAGGNGGTGGGTPPPDGATAAPATAPTGVTATATADGVDVGWAAVEGASSYTVTATSAAAGAANPAPVTVQAPATTASLTGLTAGTEYTVTVTPGNSVGSGPTGTTTVTTGAAAAPQPFNLTRVLPGNESITAEWTAAQPANASSPVTGYDLVATPADGQAAVTASVTGTTGTVTGLRNGIEYAVSVVAKSGAATTTATTGTVDNTVTPNDVVTVGRAEYRADKSEYRATGTAQDTTANTVTVSLSTGTLIQANIPVAADGSWTLNRRNGPALPAGATLTVTSSSGANLTGVAITRR
jgi:Fibronectin type III domain